MGATVFEVTSWETAAFDLHTGGLFSRGVNPRRERHCPHCDSIVYSRRHKVCGVCCQPLPVACTFTDEESNNVRSLLAEERERHRKWLNRIDSGI